MHSQFDMAPAAELMPYRTTRPEWEDSSEQLFHEHTLASNKANSNRLLGEIQVIREYGSAERLRTGNEEGSHRLGCSRVSVVPRIAEIVVGDAYRERQGTSFRGET